VVSFLEGLRGSEVDLFCYTSIINTTTKNILLPRHPSYLSVKEWFCVFPGVTRLRICICWEAFRCCSSRIYPTDCNSDACDETEESCELWICTCLDPDPDGVEQHSLDEVDKPALEINSDTKEEDKSQNKANSAFTKILRNDEKQKISTIITRYFIEEFFCNSKK